MRTTRDMDIAKIEEDMASGLISHEAGMRLIDKLYRQAKDDKLEERRRKLIEDQKKYDREYQMVRQRPEKLTRDQFLRYREYFEKHPNEF